VIVLHEPFTWRMAIAAGLVFGGVALVRLAQRPKATQASSSKAAANGTVEPGKREAANLKRRSVA
jgi:hypothetical protein